MPSIGRSFVRDLGEVISGLSMAYDAGRLVPFVGTGLSMPYCRGWASFIEALATNLGADAAQFRAGPQTNPEVLNRNADRLAAWLRLREPAMRRDILCQALRGAAGGALPDQSLALAKGFWPLVVTSNYDDILPVAMRKQGRSGVRVMGRSPSDCIQVVRALDLLQDPIVWYIQGHVAGVVEQSPGIAEPTATRDVLLDEIVVGHQQYQQAINASTAFRRAFSEVFRRRSLLFVGSGLAESYFVNLISESLFTLGPSAMPHYALMSRGDLDKTDPEFLAVRLGITPILYGEDHGQLPAALDRIVEPRSISIAQREMPVPVLSTITYSVARATADQTSPASCTPVTLNFKQLPGPSVGTSIVLSVGIDRALPPKPRIGRMVRSYYNAHAAAWPGQLTDQIPVVPKTPQDRWLFVPVAQQAGSPIVLAAARDVDDGSIGTRSLESITRATMTALRHIESEGVVGTVVMGLLSAGPGRRDIPPFCLAAQLAGVRNFLATPPPAGKPPLQRIELCIVDPVAWAPVASGRLPVAEILVSELTRVLVRVADGQGRWEEYAMSVPHDWTVDRVLGAYDISDEGVEVAAHPLPTQRHAAMLPVFPGMVVEVKPMGTA